MLLLIFDIFRDRFDVRARYAERTETLLPRESLSEPFLDPSRRIRFDKPHCVGNRNVWRQQDQQMNMIAHTVDYDRRAFQLFNQSAHIGEEFFHYLGCDQRQMTLRAENDVTQQVGMRVRHRLVLCRRLRRLVLYCLDFPHLSMWATNIAPSPTVFPREYVISVVSSFIGTAASRKAHISPNIGTMLQPCPDKILDFSATLCYRRNIGLSPQRPLGHAS